MECEIGGDGVRYLSLFSGAGGGDLASQHLLNHNCVGYVEYEKYCQKVLRQRIKDGLLDAAPVFGDIRRFVSEGYAGRYTGLVDVITAGFPCQPFSVAGKQRGADDERNMWPATMDTIRIIRPGYAFLENVPGLLVSGYFGTILSDLHEIGYNAKWTVLGASDIGAPHKRKRLWILAERVKPGLERYTWNGKNRDKPGWNDSVKGRSVGKGGLRKGNMAHTNGKRAPRWAGCDKADRCDRGQKIQSQWKPEKYNWFPEPNVGRVANGVANRVDRLKAIGNGQVPQVAATAWRILTGG